MATFLDVTAIGYFNPLFSSLFVALIIFAVLNKTEMLGKNAAIHWVLAILVGLIFASSRVLTRTFEIGAPWYVMTAIIIIFANILPMFLGAKTDHLPFNPTTTSMMTIIGVIVGVIFFVSLGQALDEQDQVAIDAGQPVPETFGGKLAETIRHPSVLGIILVFLVATFTVLMLSTK